MCLAQVEFVDSEGKQRSSALSEVAWIERTPAGLRITDLLGRVTEIDAEIRCIDFMRPVVCVECRATTPAGQE
jgi:predicted RNA-binding protein